MVETINIHPLQLDQTNTWWAYRGASKDVTVTERLTLTGRDTIRYRFTIEDPGMFTAPVTGELLFTRTGQRCCTSTHATKAMPRLGNILSAERAKEKRETDHQQPHR